MKRGFTLIEIILVIAIASVIASITVSAFSRFNRAIAIRKDAEKIVSILNKARSNTIAARSGSQYGVHFESGRVVMFVGNIYSALAPTNEPLKFQSPVSASTISLAGGGSDVVFERLTGITSNFGFVILSLTGEPLVTRRVNISSNGLVDIQ